MVWPISWDGVATVREMVGEAQGRVNAPSERQLVLDQARPPAARLLVWSFVRPPVGVHIPSRRVLTPSM